MISRLVTSTFGSPGAEFVHVVVPAARRRAPKSVPAYRSPVTSSRTRSLTGRSPKLYDLSTHVDVPVPGLYVTSTMCCGLPGVLAPYPLYEIHAWFPFAGST